MSNQDLMDALLGVIDDYQPESEVLMHVLMRITAEVAVDVGAELWCSRELPDWMMIVQKENDVADAGGLQ